MQWRPRFGNLIRKTRPVTPNVVTAAPDDMPNLQRATEALMNYERKKPVVEQTAPESTTPTFKSVPQSTFVAPTEGPGSNWHPVIQNAIDKQHEIELVYRGASDTQGVQRVIIPTEMGPGRQPNVTALRAFDPNAGVHKEFRTDRIVKMLESRPRSVEPPEDPTPLTVAPVQRQTPQSIADNILPNPLSLYLYEDKAGDIEPTPEEYEELRTLDIDPDTHDKATIRRLRNKGASHIQLKEVAQQQEGPIPYEDYERALETTGNHTSAIQEALKMRARDKEQIATNQQRVNAFPNYNEKRSLSPKNHSELAQSLFVHHLQLRNAPEFSPDARGPYLPIQDRRRANEWVLSELSKIYPSFKDKIQSDYFNNLETLQGDNIQRMDGVQNRNYYDVVNNLAKHHGGLLATATDHASLVKQRRIMKVLSHVGNARFYPHDYNADMYEEA